MRLVTLYSLAALVVGALAGLEDAKYSQFLDSKDFEATLAKDGYRGALVALFAPWCGHCKKLEGAWTDLGATFQNEDGVLIAHVDCDAAKNKDLASKLGVQGFPTIKYFANGKIANPADYNGGRTAADLVSYVNAKTGSHRKAGGLLDTMAGRLPDFDALVKQFVGAPTATRGELMASASALASKLNGTVSESTAAAAYYVRVLQKMAASNAEEAQSYVQTESARLQKIAGRKGQLAGKKLDELQLKQNILAAFSSAQGAAAGAYDAAADAASDAADAVKSATASAASAASSLAGDAASAAASATDRVKSEL